MKVYSEKGFNDFEFWSGAKDRAEKLTTDEGDMIFACLEECYPEGLSKTEIDDIFWFEEDFLAEVLDTSHLMKYITENNGGITNE